MKIEKLKLKNLGIDSQQEHFAYMRKDCPVCVSEGFEALTRIAITHKNKTIVATLNTLNSDLLQPGEVSVSTNAWKILDAKEGDTITVSHLPPLLSFAAIRGKLYGKQISKKQFREIISDIKKGIYSNTHVSSFVTACAGDNLDIEEITWLTESMVEIGESIKWGKGKIVDKHCVGGLPGNRTTPIVVSIVAASGLIIPKTSSRAITSPAGTADTMETVTNVSLPIAKIKEVIKKENGCFVWGGGVQLSPVDDILIRVERALDIDSEGQMVASVLSKKKAAGSKSVVIDIPVGKTAKVRSKIEALKLKYLFSVVGMAIGIDTEIIISNGSQPVGIGIGPALEAKDVLKVLRNDSDAPKDLEEHALTLAGKLLELGGKAKKGTGFETALQILKSGAAYQKFMAICIAQGGFKEPPSAKYQYDVIAEKAGKITEVDNRKIAKIAKLLGAPSDKAAGLSFYAKINRKVNKGDVLYRMHAETKGILNYALSYVNSQSEIITIK